jgi:tetratricopeptide (TPR) repeat protein
MRTRTTSSVRSSWIAALACCATSSLGAVAVHAQPAADASPQAAPAEAAPQPQLSPEEADRKARALFQDGKQAFENGQYRDAWDYFRKAYLLSKRPELLYNVGQSADRLRMDREALDAFRLYLEKLPNAANRREVENRVRALEDRLGETPQGPGAQDTGALDIALPDDAQTDTAASNGADADAAPPEPPPNDGQPKRKGWYVRLALGLGLLHDSVSNLASPVSINSPTLASLIGVGYDLDEGIVIGGALAFDWSLSPKVANSSVELKAANLSLLMAFIDYYLEPRRDGWHLLGGLGFGSYSLSDDSATVGSENAGGIGVLAGGGYEWPVDREWALGVLGRLVLAGMNQDTGHHVVLAPSVAFTAAWY